MSRRMNMAELMGNEDEEGELNLTPYLDIITTLVIFMIFTFQVVIEFRLIDVFVPAYGPGVAAEDPKPDKPQITVTLLILPDMFSILASAGVDRLDIPIKGGKHDFERLHEMLVTYKDKLELGESLILIADDKTEYSLIVETMDAVRMDGKRLLFPDVALATASTGGGK